MNTKSLLLSILVIALAVWATDFLIHAVWLSPVYAATKELWRTEAEMMAKMPFMFAGQFLIGAAFTLLFASCVAEKRSLRSSLTFGACIGVIAAAGQLIMYSVEPYPGSLVAKWCVAYILQGLLLALIVHKVYKPLPAK